MADALALTEKLDADACRVKIGKELFTRAGPEVVSTIVKQGFEVFLDLKFHDIPNTVAAACRVAADLGVWMVNVHASGGREMMTAAAEALANCSRPPHLIAVTVLTSMNNAALSEIGVTADTRSQVVSLAQLTAACGLDGVVCSPLEVLPLRQQLPPEFLLVTPGVRPAEASLDDQVRVATPENALLSGADYLVIGRPITRASDPPDALAQINRSCNDALSPAKH